MLTRQASNCNLQPLMAFKTMRVLRVSSAAFVFIRNPTCRSVCTQHESVVSAPRLRSCRAVLAFEHISTRCVPALDPVLFAWRRSPGDPVDRRRSPGDHRLPATVAAAYVELVGAYFCARTADYVRLVALHLPLALCMRRFFPDLARPSPVRAPVPSAMP